MVVSNRLDERGFVYRLRIFELQQDVSRWVVAHAIWQPRPLRCAPCFSLPTQEQHIGFGRLPQKINLYMYRDLHRRQGQMQESAEDLM
jgi:hypothetical protein